MSALAWLSLWVAAEVAAAAPAPARDRGASVKLQGALIHTGIGPWGGVARAEAEPRAGDSWSAGVAYSTLAYMTFGQLSARYRHLYRIGAGQGGFDGGADIDAALGRLWPLAEQQALVARVGARGYVYGNRRLYASLLELPAAEAGYQLLSPDWHLELLARAGVSLVGRHRALDEPSRRLGGALIYGAGAALGWRALNVELGWRRIAGEGSRLEATGCAIAGQLALCAELAHLSTARAGDGVVPGDMQSQTLTVWLGVGASERK